MDVFSEDIQSGNESSIDIKSISIESTAGGSKRKSSAMDATRANLITPADRVELTAAALEQTEQEQLELQ
ncbi:MAG: hypothetical protein K0S36_708 [Nitrosospira multiformis]|jgi:hypothetical protein|nr:hypothetical protein [Nitrosospira multiformis]